ncbi:5'-methylthioadenosine/adenosylhomocysteine nucleosidase [Paenibacillus urinalis]|uniref:adenosylhomocysteine nucleosidase n=1 Tax=Paenibacillus urinalis TaxID=521520 RepID=A0AAX3MVI3_9BACL|nr:MULTISPECIES: 5'-methylthioadenosine/adenosylhomocysteine nucleosidase [Paenibacillus]WDH81461.1 5'-methylthioadenosine/adenosylhomocysteine nucleosidase [Paenibacillus urinalis]WDH97511.1 5'-methylthioadenosine/adenosylhomocysteine nucleosidase [Paenibacillus urinalis]WDI01178.1 5'-methylthioadenosine/adenosylhomocysteine nucleosidase [Paenibacillus urinalis]
MAQTIGLIGAMDEEIELLLSDMENIVRTDFAGITYTEGDVYGKHVVVCKSGVGKVNAAVTTQILIEKFSVSHIIFTGVAGAVHPDLEIGDIVISTACIHHDIDVTPLGYKRGEIPYQETSAFPADAELIKRAAEACEELSARYISGIVLSGDQFIASKEVVSSLRDEFEGACAEMEGAAVAQVSFMNKIPYVILRAMSDKADGSAHVNFAEFTVESAQKSHRIVEHMLANM